MIVMGLDSSLQRCSVAIINGAEVMGMKILEMERGHAEQIAPMVADILDKTSLTIADFQRIGVVVGPGGFTGIRVALAFARGLAIGGQTDVVGVSSLAALASAGREVAPPGALTAPIIDARRGQVYAALYDSDGAERLGGFVADPKQSLKNIADNAGGEAVAMVGSGVGLLPETPGNFSALEASAQIDPVIVARLAMAATPTVAERPSPIYLRAPDAKPAQNSPLTP